MYWFHVCARARVGDAPWAALGDEETRTAPGSAVDAWRSRGAPVAAGGATSDAAAGVAYVEPNRRRREAEAEEARGAKARTNVQRTDSISNSVGI